MRFFHFLYLPIRTGNFEIMSSNPSGTGMVQGIPQNHNGSECSQKHNVLGTFFLFFLFFSFFSFFFRSFRSSFVLFVLSLFFLCSFFVLSLFFLCSFFVRQIKFFSSSCQCVICFRSILRLSLAILLSVTLHYFIRPRTHQLLCRIIRCRRGLLLRASESSAQ